MKGFIDKHRRDFTYMCFSPLIHSLKLIFAGH